MYNGLIVKDLLKQKNVKQIDLIRYMDWQGSASVASFMNRNPTASQLEKVADFFGVSIDTFFIRNGSDAQKNNVIGNGNNVGNIHINDTALATENEFLKDKIKQLEKQIEILEKFNKVLMDKQVQVSEVGQNSDTNRE